MIARRGLLAGLSLGLFSPALLVRAAQTAKTSKAAIQPSHIRLGPASPYTFAVVRELAKKSASQPYKAASENNLATGIDFDATQQIKFRPDHALWGGTGARYPVSFFHLNVSTRLPVLIHAIDQGMARQVLYGTDYFDYGASRLNPAAAANLGFAGFRVMDGQDVPTDWLAFQGASYFRSSGQDGQYGASARGIAVNTALSTREEFPRFTRFWLAEQDGLVRVDALLEGPSVTGAYRFEARKGEAVAIDTHCELFFRADITRLGIAPLTSMYWYGENEHWRAIDWRPEIHDSDGLSLYTGKGERLWRPLTDPAAMQTNFFEDENPRGFGLMQRDRAFEDYQDDGAFYNRRPGLWVEPRGKWGKGAVMLAELPTDDEIHDNIVAYWKPERDIASGDTLSLDYRLSFIDAEPGFPAGLGRCVATRLGRGGVPGSSNVPVTSRKFVIDFQGGPLAKMAARYDVTPVISASRGNLGKSYVVKVVGTDRWRAVFDLDATGPERVELRCFLALNGKRMTETWLYHYFYNGPRP